MSNQEFAERSARVFMENMIGFDRLANQMGATLTPAEAVNSSFSRIAGILAEDLPLARLMDQSDILLHAEGPGAAHGMPWMRSLTWLLGTLDTNVRRLCATTLDLLNAPGEQLSKRLDLRVPGVMPGSLWIGVSLQAGTNDLLPPDADLLARLTEHIASLPALTRFIEDEGLAAGIDEQQPDPAVRDAQLYALMKLAPTGKVGIHTVELSSKSNGAATLSQRERVVLREAIARPSQGRSEYGSFVGDVRAADLDKARIHLRNVPDIGTIRCVLPYLNSDHAVGLLGKTARVSGRYLTDPQGRPRLLFVEDIVPIEQLRLHSPA